MLMELISKLETLQDVLQGEDLNAMKKSLTDVLYMSYEPYDENLQILTVLKAEELFNSLEEFYNTPMTKENAYMALPVVTKLLKILKNGEGRVSV